MKIIPASFEIKHHFKPNRVLRHVEEQGRICYLSEDKISDTSAKEFCHVINSRKHHSVMEHASVTVRFTVNRGFTHELVRHRLASFSQESTRYVGYNKGKYGSQITVIDPIWVKDTKATSSVFKQWKEANLAAEKSYMDMVAAGAKPEQARDVLPNDLKAKIAITANLRQWRTILELRTSPFAHFNMRELMVPLWVEFNKLWPELFGTDELKENCNNWRQKLQDGEFRVNKKYGIPPKFEVEKKVAPVKESSLVTMECLLASMTKNVAMGGSRRAAMASMDLLKAIRSGMLDSRLQKWTDWYATGLKKPLSWVP